MRAIGSFVVAVLFFVTATCSAETETPQKGAKELFFDPAGDRVTAATPLGGQSLAPSPQRTPSRPGPRKPGSPRPPVGSPIVQVAKKEPPKPLGLSYWIELEGMQGSAGQRVTDQQVFKSGERIRLHFLSNANGQIALLQVGGHGVGSSLLFPDATKGLEDASIVAQQDHILPGEAHWLRFDEHPGTERLVVVFARSREEIKSLPVRPTMDPSATLAVLHTAEGLRGAKDLLIETDTLTPSQAGTYGVTLSGKPVILEIALKHE